MSKGGAWLKTGRSRGEPDAYALLFGALGVVTETIAETFGPDCEVVLHDLRSPRTSVVKVVNGHVTNRKVGQGIRDLVGILRSPRFKNDQLTNYPLRAEKGKAVKSSTALIRDEEGEVLAAICINWDVTPLRLARNLLDEMSRTAEADGEEAAAEPQPQDVSQTLEQLIQNIISEYGSPNSLGKEERLRIVQFLEGRGAFLIRGAMDRVAEALGVSRYSIYKYLEELRGQHDGTAG